MPPSAVRETKTPGALAWSSSIGSPPLRSMSAAVAVGLVTGSWRVLLPDAHADATPASTQKERAIRDNESVIRAPDLAPPTCTARVTCVRRASNPVRALALRRATRDGQR